MTERQKRFVDAYIANPNATQAAIQAGYSPKRANAIGYDLLTNTDVKQAINERNNALDSKRIADIEECLIGLTQIIRGEKVSERIERDSDGNLITVMAKPTITEINKAIETRLKTLNAIRSSVELTGANGGPMQMQVQTLADLVAQIDINVNKQTS